MEAKRKPYGAIDGKAWQQPDYLGMLKKWVNGSPVVGDCLLYKCRFNTYKHLFDKCLLNTYQSHLNNSLLFIS